MEHQPSAAACHASKRLHLTPLFRIGAEQPLAHDVDDGGTQPSFSYAAFRQSPC